MSAQKPTGIVHFANSSTHCPVLIGRSDRMDRGRDVGVPTNRASAKLLTQPTVTTVLSWSWSCGLALGNKARQATLRHQLPPGFATQAPLLPVLPDSCYDGNDVVRFTPPISALTGPPPPKTGAFIPFLPIILHLRPLTALPPTFLKPDFVQKVLCRMSTSL